MSDRISFIVSMAVACAINFDDPTIRTALCGQATVKRLRKGFRVTGTAAEMMLLAFHMDRNDGFDLSPATIAACNRAALRLRTLVKVNS